MKAELRHDSLASRIYAKASSEEKALRKVHNFIRKRLGYYKDRGVLMGKEDFAYVNPYLDQLFLDEEEQAFLEKSRKTFSNRRRLIRAGVVLGILFVNFVGFSIYQWQQAETFAQLAEVRVDSAAATQGLIAQQVALIAEEKEKVEGLTHIIQQEKVRVDSLKDIAIVLADSAREAEKLADAQKEVADSYRRIYEAAEKRIQKLSDRSQALFMLSEATALLDSGDFRLAFLLAEQAHSLSDDSLSKQVLIEIAQSRVQYNLNHEAPITATDLSLNQKTLLSGSQDGELKITPLFTQRKPITLSHQGAINDLGFSRDQRYVISASEDQTAVVWSLRGRKIHTLSHEAPVNQASFTNFGNILTASDDQTAKLWDKEGKLVTSFEHKGKVLLAVADKTERYVLTASADRSAGLWTRAGERIGTFEHKKAVTHALFSPQQGLILTASTDGMVKLWSRDTQTLLAEIPHEAPISSIAFRSDFEDQGIRDQLLEDTDGDGIPNFIDKEPDTPGGAPVDKFGIALDTDGDGVIDLKDLENNTPWGAEVDEAGQALDTDQDGVIDHYDLEKDTPKGAAVSALGIALDSDGDKVIDLFDKEAETPRGLAVDARGVTLDTDADGVSEFLDKEPRTPKGANVDFWGRALDRDQDGVIDLYDKEPNSAPKARVNQEGITDSDGDGIIDRMDQEVYSPERAEINEKGWADNDKDGFVDGKDKEWYTPETAEVDPEGVAVDTDGDGFPDLIDFEQETPPAFRNQVDAFGRRPEYPGDVRQIDPFTPAKYILDSDDYRAPHQYYKDPSLRKDIIRDVKGTSGSPDVIPQFILTAAADGEIQVMDLGNARLKYQISAPAQLMDVRYFQEKQGEILAVSSFRNQVMVFDSAQEVVDLMSHPAPIYSVQVFRNLDVLTGSEDGRVRIWAKPQRFSDPQKILAYYRNRFHPLTQIERKRFGLTR